MQANFPLATAQVRIDLAVEPGEAQPEDVRAALELARLDRVAGEALAEKAARACRGVDQAGVWAAVDLKGQETGAVSRYQAGSRELRHCQTRLVVQSPPR